SFCSKMPSANKSRTEENEGNEATYSIPDVTLRVLFFVPAGPFHRPRRLGSESNGQSESLAATERWQPVEKRSRDREGAKRHAKLGSTELTEVRRQNRFLTGAALRKRGYSTGR